MAMWRVIVAKSGRASLLRSHFDSFAMNSRKTCCVMSSINPGQGAYLSATPFTKS
jgi:hypothetical protein